MYVAFDFSLTATGTIALDGGKTVLRETFKTDLRGGARLAAIADYAVETLRLYKPDESLMEAPFAAPSPAVLATCLRLAELHGAILAQIAKARVLRPYYVAPATLKLYATGKGKAQKSDIKMAILKKWGEEFKDDNQADAFVLAKMAEHLDAFRRRVEGDWLEYERKCIQTVINGPANEERLVGLPVA